MLTYQFATVKKAPDKTSGASFYPLIILT